MLDVMSSFVLKVRDSYHITSVVTFVFALFQIHNPDGSVIFLKFVSINGNDFEINFAQSADIA